MNDKTYLNLGSMLYVFEGENIWQGTFLPFPHRAEHNFLYIEPIAENRLVAHIINNYRTNPDPTEWLILMDDHFLTTRVIDRYDLRELVFCSLFTTGKSIYVVNYDEKNEQYFLLRYPMP